MTSATRAEDAANIEYIALNTTIPVPWVRDVFIIDQRTQIVIEHVSGSSLILRLRGYLRGD